MDVRSLVYGSLAGEDLMNHVAEIAAKMSSEERAAYMKECNEFGEELNEKAQAIIQKNKEAGIPICLYSDEDDAVFEKESWDIARLRIIRLGLTKYSRLANLKPPVDPTP